MSPERSLQVVGIEAAPNFLDVSLEPGASCWLPIAPDSTCFAVTVTGSLSVGREDGGVEEVPDERVVLFGEGDGVELTAGPSGARVLVVSGKPLCEPVAWGGPIVMNTKEELREAFRALEDGTFLKHK